MVISMTIDYIFKYSGSPQPCDLNDQTLKLKVCQKFYSQVAQLPSPTLGNEW